MIERLKSRIYFVVLTVRSLGICKRTRWFRI